MQTAAAVVAPAGVAAVAAAVGIQVVAADVVQSIGILFNIRYKVLCRHIRIASQHIMLGIRAMLIV